MSKVNNSEQYLEKIIALSENIDNKVRHPYSNKTIIYIFLTIGLSIISSLTIILIFIFFL